MLSLPVIASSSTDGRPSEERRLAAVLDRLASEGVERVALWGAGAHTRTCRNELGRKRPQIVCIVDDARADAAQRLFGLPVVSRAAALERGIQAVVISTDQWEDHIWRQRGDFESRGVPVVRLYPPGWAERMTLIIEIAGLCNARCTYCPTGNGEKPAGQFMPVELFRSILGHLHRQELIKSPIMPFNYGEPLIHPRINDILGVVAEFGYTARISTNLQFLPRLTPSSMATLSLVDVSISGMTQASYSRGHGGKLVRVLENVDRLLAMRDEAGAAFPVRMRWHRYRFNEDELDEAQAFCEARGIGFLPYFAHLNDLMRVAGWFNNSLGDAARAEMKADLFTGHMERVVGLFRRTETQDCVQFHDLTIDEEGCLLPCCAVHSHTPGARLGRVLEMDAAALRRVKRSWDFCSTCMSNGWSGYVNSYLQPADLGVPDEEFGARGVAEADPEIDERFAELAERLVAIPPRARVAVWGFDAEIAASFGRWLQTIASRHVLAGFVDDRRDDDSSIHGVSIVAGANWRSLRPDAIVSAIASGALPDEAAGLVRLIPFGATTGRAGEPADRLPVAVA